MSKNILVTGGSGFIGSHVVNSLIKKKHKVTIYDLKSPKRNDIKFIKGSILDKNLMNSALRSIDIIFHLAAMSDINKAKSIPVKTIETNILGTAYLLEEARKSRVERFVFAGSIYSYGNAGNVYTTSKTASEDIIKNYQLLYGQEFTILRYATAYGPKNRTVDAISIFVRQALKNLNLTIHGNGRQKRNYIYVEDLAEGSMIALKKISKNKTITLSAKKNIKILDLAKTIIKLTKSKSKININKKKKRFDDYNSSSGELQKNVFSHIWKPKYSLIDGLKKYINLEKKVL